MKIKHLGILLLASVFISGCATVEKPQMTPLQIQAIQTQKFNASYKVAYKSIMSVFQDLGYTIDSTNYDTGIIKAESSSKSKHDWIWTGNTYSKKVTVIANVEERKNKVLVRLSFINKTKTSSAWGQTSDQGDMILDSKIYRNAFTKIKNAIFIRK